MCVCVCVVCGVFERRLRRRHRQKHPLSPVRICFIGLNVCLYASFCLFSYKAKVATETVLKFNPHVSIEAFTGNIKEPRFDVEF